jgi:hypothetical protein
MFAMTLATKEDRLAQKPRQEMAGVLAPPHLRESIPGQGDQPKPLIQVAIRQQTAVGRDLAAMEPASAAGRNRP